LTATTGRYSSDPTHSDFKRGLRVELNDMATNNNDKSQHIILSNVAHYTAIIKADGASEVVKSGYDIHYNILSTVVGGIIEGVAANGIYDPLKALGRTISKELLNEEGLALRDKGEYDRAIERYNQAITLDPTSAILFFNRGNSYNFKGEYDQRLQLHDHARSKLRGSLQQPWNRLSPRGPV